MLRSLENTGFPMYRQTGLNMALEKIIYVMVLLLLYQAGITIIIKTAVAVLSEVNYGPALLRGGFLCSSAECSLCGI